MAKETTEKTEAQTQPAAPKLQADLSKAQEGLATTKKEVEHNPSEYLITGPDGLDFNVNEATYKRNYEGREGFTVKKNPNKQ